MRILITHLTRMARGFCCVAGVAEGHHGHIRPVIGQRLTTDLLAPAGPFDFGAIVDLGKVHPAGHTPPETEDHLFQQDRCARHGYVSASRLWEILAESARDSLFEIFGAELERHPAGRASLPLLAGAASLGVYRPIAGAELVRGTTGGSAALRVRLPAEGMDLSLTDARYYTNDFQEPHEDRLREAQRCLEPGEGVLLGVGLTRPFASSEEQVQRHWLQVNAIHLQGHPGLRLA